MKNKGFVHILVLILVVLGVGVLRYLVYKNGRVKINKITIQDTYTHTDSVDWKEFVSTGGNYSFKYPKNYKLLENKKMSVDGVENESKDTVTLVSPYINNDENNFIISITHFKNSLSFKEAIQCNLVEKSGAEYSLASNKALVFKNAPCGPLGSTIIFLKGKNYLYRFEIVTQGSYEEIEKYSDQILSTFKFTE